MDEHSGILLGKECLRELLHAGSGQESWSLDERWCLFPITTALSLLASVPFSLLGVCAFPIECLNNMLTILTLSYRKQLGFHMNVNLFRIKPFLGFTLPLYKRRHLSTRSLPHEFTDTVYENTSMAQTNPRVLPTEEWVNDGIVPTWNTIQQWRESAAAVSSDIDKPKHNEAEWKKLKVLNERF